MSRTVPNPSRSPESIPAPTSHETGQIPAGAAKQVPASHETPSTLTNRTVAIRLRFLMSQLTEEPPPPLSTRLSPTSKEHHRTLSLSASTQDYKEAAT